jgi:alanine racemase
MNIQNKHKNNPLNAIIETTTLSPQTFIEINQAAINHNIAYYKKRIGHHNKLAVVIKGNGYGHGLVEMGAICQQNDHVDWLCAANLSEAIILHISGVTKPVLVLGYADIELHKAAEKNIAFMVDNFEYAQKLNALGKHYSYQFPIHLKIDTGLSRLGIPPHTASDFIKKLSTLPYLKIDGIFSHFIASDNNPELTNQQLHTFTSTVQSITTTRIPHIHMSNTMATTSLDYPSFFNFFRVGLGVYGFGSPENQLQPALSWKTHIVSVKTVPENSYVSYACTYKTKRTTRIALLPIGYADGYQLRFSNKTSVLINNQLAPVIGRVGMNMTMIDVTDCSAKAGDIVTLVGNCAPMRATDIAYTAEIHNVRELLTGIHPNITRIIK